MISFEKTLFWDGWFKRNAVSVPEWARAEQLDKCAPLTQIWSIR